MIRKILLSTIFITLLSAYAGTTTPLIVGLNNFAFNLVQKIIKPNNLIISPYSLSSVLTILAIGAKSNTQEQLVAVLHLPKNISNFFIPVNAMQSNNFIIANALWAQNNLNYKKSFLEQLKKNKSINFYRLDFTNATKATKTINDWVSQKTRGKIIDLIPMGAIDSMTRLVITNAIYFKDDWLYPFRTEQTKLLPFTLKDNTKINVATMQQQHEFAYTENNKFQVLQLPYSKSHLTMLIFLPKSKTITSFTMHDLENSLSMLQPNEVQVFLPKFKINTTLDNLTQVLQQMGISDAFTSCADFSNLVIQPIYVSLIIQKAMIEVDEKGTTAAAATGAVMRLTAFVPTTAPKIFRADHPFNFLIYDTQSNVILFMGQVVNPNEST